MQIVFVRRLLWLLGSVALLLATPHANAQPQCKRWVARPGQSIAGLDGYAYVILPLENGEFIAGGTFTLAGSTVVRNIARWNGTSW